MLGVLDEFGQYAKIADWAEITDLYGDDFTEFLEETGVRDDEDVWVQCDGNRFYGSTRHYFLAFINGDQRDDFMIHDQVDDIAWLGSWYDIELRVLVKVPSDQLK